MHREAAPPHPEAVAGARSGTVPCAAILSERTSIHFAYAPRCARSSRYYTVTACGLPKLGGHEPGSTLSSGRTCAVATADCTLLPARIRHGPE